MQFMDISTRVRLAACNTALQRRIFEECRQAWVKIDFVSVAAATCQRLSDYHLSTLLTRVNARDVTEMLGLQACSEIRGLGLTPLQNSRVLKSIDLLGTGADRDPAPFISILYTMVPYNLFDVRLRQASDRNAGDHLVYFMRNLRRAKRKQMIEQETPCDCCSLPVMEQSRQMVPRGRGDPSMCCAWCGKYFCGRGSCPMPVSECGCACLFCKDCDVTRRCQSCKCIRCQDCGPITGCGSTLR